MRSVLSEERESPAADRVLAQLFWCPPAPGEPSATATSARVVSLASRLHPSR